MIADARYIRLKVRSPAKQVGHRNSGLLALRRPRLGSEQMAERVGLFPKSANSKVSAKVLTFKPDFDTSSDTLNDTFSQVDVSGLLAGRSNTRAITSMPGLNFSVSRRASPRFEGGAGD